MLHAGVLMKLGAFGVMRVGMVLLPEGTRFWVPVVGAVAAINVLYGAFCAMSQTDLKYIVAYSSVSHMGVVMLGAATLTTAGWNGAVFQMVAHGIMTGLLFALVGPGLRARAHARHRQDGRLRHGDARRRRLLHPRVPVVARTAGDGGVRLRVPRVPRRLAERPHFWAIPAVLGAFVTAIYVLKATRAIFWGPGPGESFHELSDARRTEWGALAAARRGSRRPRRCGRACCSTP